MNQQQLKQQITQPQIISHYHYPLPISKPKSKSKSKSKQKSKQKHILIQQQNSSQSMTQNDKQKIKNKKYDYLNKYHQHQLLGKFYQVTKPSHMNINTNTNMINQDKSLIETRKNFLQRRMQLQDRRQDLSRENLSRSLPKSQSRSQPKQRQLKQKQKIRSNSKSSNNSRNISNKKNSQAYHHFLEAYQNNIVQQHNNYHSYSPKKQYKSELYQKLHPQIKQLSINNNNQNRLNKLVTRIPNISNGLSVQISHQNQIYKNQINQYRTMVTRLQIQLNRYKQQLLTKQQKYINQKLGYEQIIIQLKNQIIMLNGYKQRYQILNQDMINMSMRIHNQRNQRQRSRSRSRERQRERQRQRQFDMENKENYRYDNNYDDCVNRSINKGKIKKVQNNFNNNNIEKSIFQKLETIINGNKDKVKKSLCFSLNQNSQQIIQKIQKLVQANKKYQNFIFNIKQMHKKIQKIQIFQPHKNKNNSSTQPNIRDLWKWLKIIGSNYSFLLGIKTLLARKAGINQYQSETMQIKQILELLLVKV